MDIQSEISLKRILLGLCVLCSVLCVSSSAQSTAQVRVLVVKEAASLSLKVDGSYQIMDADQGTVLSKGRGLKTTVTAYKQGLLLAGQSFPKPRVFIQTLNPDTVIINGRVYRGNVLLIKTESAKLSVINYINLEDYVKGISIREISHYWPPEALKAQVIVFRTFALYKIEESKGRDYDVTSDIYSQVYGAVAAERYRINKAVDETKDMVLNYKDKIFPSFYHATCAGHTEDASILWNIDIAPLKGVVCKFCKDSPHFNWHEVIFTQEIREKLIDSGYKIGVIKNISVLGRDDSGRITDLRITDQKKEIKVSAKDFRNIMGPDIIKSTNFNTKIQPPDAIFEGIGWGHGVGLCQWGAYFMAKQGYSAFDILKYYYPQTDVKTLKF